SAISILGARKMETIKALSAIVWLRKALATSASDSMYLPEASDSIATASVTSSNRIITVQACVSIWREYQLLRKTSRLSIAHPLSGHMDKKRRTKQCGDDADRHFLGNQHDTRQHVSKQSQPRPENRVSGQQPAKIAGQKTAHNVRDDESDKADIAGQRHRCARQQDDNDAQERANDECVLSKAARDLVAGDQNIDMSGQQETGGKTDQQIRIQMQDRRHFTSGNRAGHPEQNAVQPFLADHQQRLGERRKQRSNGGACQYNTKGTAAAQHADAIDQRAGNRSADKGQQHELGQ